MAKPYPKEVSDYIYKNYKGIGNTELSELINKKFDTNYRPKQIKSWKKNHSLDSGLTGHFGTGFVPWNKGTRGLVKPNSGNFKPGNKPANWRTVGSKRVTKDGYVEIKVSNKPKWKLAHRILWEQEVGPLKKNEVLIFLDGNKENITLNNLEKITKGERAVINHQVKLGNDAEINKSKILMAKLISAKSKRKKNK